MKRQIIKKVRGGKNKPFTPSVNPGTVNKPVGGIEDVGFLKGILYFFEGAGIVLIVFGISYWIIRFFIVDYILISFISLLFTALAIYAFDKTTGRKPTPLSGPVQAFIIIVFVLSLLYGYKYGNNNGYFSNNAAIELTSESGTISEVDQFWATAKNFKKGENITVKISGSSVKLNKSDQLLKPGVYTLPILSDGNLIFRGVSNTSVKIEVKE